MPRTFSRVNIDAQLRDQGQDVLDISAVRFEYIVPDKSKADYVLCDGNRLALAVVEAKEAAINPAEAEAQPKAYGRRCAEVRSILDQQEATTHKAGAAFYALLARAFDRPTTTNEVQSGEVVAA